MTEDIWLDEAAGPVVRPYAMTGGRTRPTARGLDLAAFVLAVGSPPAPSPRWFPEHLTVLELCRKPLAVAEVAARLNFSIRVARVLLSDLAEEQLVIVREPASYTRHVDDSLLKEVIDGLEAL